MRIAAGLLAALLALPCIEAGEKPSHVASARRREPYTVLQTVRYDGSSKVEVLRMSEGAWKIKEIMADYRVWKEADQLARKQWSDWFRAASDEEKRFRKWVLAMPTPPQMRTHGRFNDEFDAEAKAKELQAELDKRRELQEQIKDRTALIFLDNLNENQKLLKSLLSKARESLKKQDEIQAKRIGVDKKRQIWDTVHQAEITAWQQVRRNTPKDEEPDILEVYEMQQKMLQPLYQRYGIDEGMWSVIWEEGFLAKWPAPPSPWEEQNNGK